MSKNELLSILWGITSGNITLLFIYYVGGKIYQTITIKKIEKLQAQLSKNWAERQRKLYDRTK